MSQAGDKFMITASLVQGQVVRAYVSQAGDESMITASLVQGELVRAGCVTSRRRVYDNCVFGTR